MVIFLDSYKFIRERPFGHISTKINKFYMFIAIRLILYMAFVDIKIFGGFIYMKYSDSVKYCIISFV